MPKCNPRALAREVAQWLRRHPWPATVLLTAFTAYAAFRPARRLSDWVASCWLADYRLGFLKRGLPGQLLDAAPHSLHELTILAWCILGVLVATAAIAAARILPANTREHPATAPGMFAWWLLFVSAPFAAQQLGIDFGRFDQITLLLLLAALTAASAEGATRWLAVPLVALCPLVHEAALLLHVPVLFAAFWLRGRARDRMPCLAAAALVIAVGWLTGNAAMHGPALDRLREHLAARAADFAIPGGFAELYGYSTAECVQLTLGHWSWRVARHLAIVLALGLPMLVLTVRCWRRIGDRRAFVAAIGCLLAGLPMFVLGFDFFRWLGNLWLCQWLLLAWTAGRGNRWWELGAVVQAAPGWAIAAFVSNLYTGPIGITFALDDRLILVR